MRDKAEDWRPIRKREEKKSLKKMDAQPILSTRNFSTFENFVKFGWPLKVGRGHSPMYLSSTFSDT